ncbi:hypothetical protein [Scatolibacter rhodanostii]|uniref:hypothetical protein n=1 Tax=Scatolibacter rhodanostii TaxID=2014781 RepID=UPI000C06FA64|nr:hypothetical protein [Scatolibacter rhodanostii]
MKEKIKIISDGAYTKVFVNGESVDNIESIVFKHNSEEIGAKLSLKTYQNGLGIKTEISGFTQE